MIGKDDSDVLDDETIGTEKSRRKIRPAYRVDEFQPTQQQAWDKIPLDLDDIELYAFFRAHTRSLGRAQLMNWSHLYLCD